MEYAKTDEYRKAAERLQAITDQPGVPSSIIVAAREGWMYEISQLAKRPSTIQNLGSANLGGSEPV